MFESEEIYPKRSIRRDLSEEIYPKAICSCLVSTPKES